MIRYGIPTFEGRITPKGSNAAPALVIGAGGMGFYQGSITWDDGTVHPTLAFGTINDQLAFSLGGPRGAGPVQFDGARGNLIFGHNVTPWATSDSIVTFSVGSLTGGAMQGSINSYQLSNINASTEPQGLFMKGRGNSWVNARGADATFTASMVGATGVLTVSAVSIGTILTTNSWITLINNPALSGQGIIGTAYNPQITSQLTGSAGGTGTYQTSYSGTDIASTQMWSGGTLWAVQQNDNGMILQTFAYDGVQPLGDLFNVLGNIEMDVGTNFTAVANVSINGTTGLITVNSVVNGVIYPGMEIVQGITKFPQVTGQASGSAGGVGTYGSTYRGINITTTNVTFGSYTSGLFAIKLTPTPVAGAASIADMTHSGAQYAYTFVDGQNRLFNYGEIRSTPVDGSIALFKAVSTGTIAQLSLTNATLPLTVLANLGEITFDGFNSVSAGKTYALIFGQASDPTTTTEQGELVFQTMVAGTLTNQIVVGGTSGVGGVGIGTAPLGGGVAGTLNVKTAIAVNSSTLFDSSRNMLAGGTVACDNITMVHTGPAVLTLQNGTSPGSSGAGIQTEILFNSRNSDSPFAAQTMANLVMTVGQATTGAEYAYVQASAMSNHTNSRQIGWGSFDNTSTGGVIIGNSTATFGVGTCAATVAFYVGSNQVVSARNTGWTTQTATGAKTDLGALPTLGQLASWASAVQAALTTHGLLGA